MRFLSVGPRICLQLPSDSTSRWTPLLFSYTFPTTWACSGLSPARARPWRANKKKDASQRPSDCFCRGERSAPGGVRGLAAPLVFVLVMGTNLTVPHFSSRPARHLRSFPKVPPRMQPSSSIVLLPVPRLATGRHGNTSPG